MTDVEQTYRYRRPSTVDGGGVALATSGGPSPHPYFFSGFVEHAEPVAAALLAVARIARTRFYTPPNAVAAAIRAADPVVTADADGYLRFESLSVCCGVYGRLDLLPGSLDGDVRAHGTTNVDVNAPMRDALSGIGGLDPMHLAVGDDELRVTTLDGEVVERRVPLPERWVRSLAEVHLSARAMAPAAEYPAVAVRRFLQSQARGPQHGDLYAVPAPGGPKLATKPAPGAVGVAGLDRLRVVEPLLRRASRVRTYGRGTASAWILDLPGARFTAMLSPSPSRAFSGEGGILQHAHHDGDRGIPQHAHHDGDRGIPQHAHHDGGLDLADGRVFRRVLPFGVDPGAQPRMRDARELPVELTAEGAVVHSGDTRYVVRATAQGERCTCQWYAKHALDRGPCKHILAYRAAKG
ncbi:SWIM zinc finger family protein [Dactylosporangium sp. CS-033363]|uniref:SWIM zinc finger family protein n=1 Tax=Dactylosporangium sp. CS-033363 TaxID=3239935 RepID=UPI003D8B2C19